MILTTKADAINFVTVNIYGTGTATIDWGDGTVKTLTLSSDFSNLSDYKEYQHRYSDTVSHTITISGRNIMRLDCLCELTSIDVSRNSELRELICDGGLTTLDVSKNTKLKGLSCTRTQLTSLDVSKNTKLIHLDCYDNKLTSLDVSRNTSLEILRCFNNRLTTLDISNNTMLIKLWCSRNQLTSLDVNKNAALTDLACFYNQLTGLNVSNNIVLEKLICDDNQLSAIALNALFETLHNYDLGVKKTISICNNPGTADSDTDIATDKGWMVNRID